MLKETAWRMGAQDARNGILHSAMLDDPGYRGGWLAQSFDTPAACAALGHALRAAVEDQSPADQRAIVDPELHAAAVRVVGAARALSASAANVSPDLDPSSTLDERDVAALRSQAVADVELAAGRLAVFDQDLAAAVFAQLEDEP